MIPSVIYLMYRGYFSSFLLKNYLICINKILFLVYSSMSFDNYHHNQDTESCIISKKAVCSSVLVNPSSHTQSLAITDLFPFL